MNKRQRANKFDSPAKGNHISSILKDRVVCPREDTTRQLTRARQSVLHARQRATEEAKAAEEYRVPLRSWDPGCPTKYSRLADATPHFTFDKGQVALSST